MNACLYGFRIAGPCSAERRLVDAAAAFAGHAACDHRAEVHREAYLSAFSFGHDFRELLQATGSVRGFAGACWSAWIWFDLDAADLDAVRQDAARLAIVLSDRYLVKDDELLLFFSGFKGFHLGVSSALWTPQPSEAFNRTARRFAERIASQAAVNIDAGIYDRQRAFRAPNSRHPKTALHKRRLSLEELTGLSIDRILEMAKQPAPFDVPTPTGRNDALAADWLAAEQAVKQEAEGKAARRVASNGTPTLNRQTLDFIREGAAEGDRHRLLFSAAANLAEFACPPALAFALLSESALDAGLPPNEVRRQIECGLSHVPAMQLPATPSTEPKRQMPTTQNTADQPTWRSWLDEKPAGNGSATGNVADSS